MKRTHPSHLPFPIPTPTPTSSIEGAGQEEVKSTRAQFQKTMLVVGIISGIAIAGVLVLIWLKRRFNQKTRKIVSRYHPWMYGITRIEVVPVREAILVRSLSAGTPETAHCLLGGHCLHCHSTILSP
ncbi:hypothetical protein BDZ91DRAFT_403280 [Kalaharituber pfeilii]|nr:hypothetical protein BDZ91DRAFT_403280 [Kalaharituber pfeilii]